VAEGREHESAENFTRNILNTTNNLLLSSIGWQEITNQSNRFDTTSKIFRLVMLFPILHLSKQTPLLYTKFVPVAIISYVSARQNLFIVATVNIRAFSAKMLCLLQLLYIYLFDKFLRKRTLAVCFYSLKK
jgi:hypothetical protein